MPPEPCFFLPASKYFLVRDHCVLYMARSTSGMASSFCSSSSSERTLPRMAVSGHSVTQSMQPVQFDGIYSGISGEILLKSRKVAVPAGTSERFQQYLAGNPRIYPVELHRLHGLR